MTGAISDLLVQRLPDTPSLALASPVTGIAVAFLIALLVIRLLATVWASSTSRRVVGLVDIATAPLLIGFGVIAVSRLLEILPLG